MTRALVLEAIQRAHANFLAALDGIRDEAMTNEPVADSWSIKDLLGHVAMWMQVATQFVAEYQRDGTPTSLGLRDAAAVNAYNARGGEARRKWLLPRVRKEFDAAYRDLIAAVEKLSDEQLNAQLPEPWSPGTTLERLIAVNSYEHELEHTDQVKAWRAKQSRSK